MDEQYDVDQVERGTVQDAPGVEDERDILLPVARRGHRRAPKPRRLRSFLTLLLVLGVVVGGGYVLVQEGMERIDSFLNGPEDFAGQGTDPVVIEVSAGDSAAAIGRTLKEAGVVASVDAFTAAAAAEPASRGIQVGFYEVREEMSAQAALEVLIDPANRIRNTLTIPEGLTVDQILATIAEDTDFTERQLRAALSRPGRLGLPDYAGGDPEGYLFPATYEVPPGASAQELLALMVARWREAADAADLEAAAERLGYTPHELMTIASLVEAEARGDDMPKVSRVIYNRLETEGAPTFGKLEIDATVNYALGRNLGVALSPEDLSVDSPYNTRLYPGLPPGPIEAPGDEAIMAAANPAEGDWFFYVTVNLRTGETKFAETYDEFLTYKAEFQEYCETSDAC